MGDQAFLVTHLDQSKILLKNENNNFQTKNVIVITWIYIPAHVYVRVGKRRRIVHSILFSGSGELQWIALIQLQVIMSECCESQLVTLL